VEVIEITLAVEKGIASTCENSRALEVIIERDEIKSWCAAAQHALTPIKRHKRGAFRGELDRPAFYRNRLKPEKLIDSKSLSSLSGQGCSRSLSGKHCPGKAVLNSQSTRGLPLDWQPVL